MRTTRTLAAILSLCLLAGFFRLHRIREIPPGLFVDEAVNGLDALDISRGERLPVFVTSDEVKMSQGREPMYDYLMAATFLVTGPTVSAIRLCSALIGIAAVVATFLACRRLFGPRVALFASLLLAVSRWHVTFSRIGMRTILVPLWTALTVLTLVWLWRRPGRWSAAAFGATLGLGLYTYPAYWAVPMALGFLAVVRLVAGPRPALRPLVTLAMWAAIGWVVAVAPLGAFVLANPDTFFARAAETLDTGELLDATQKLLFMLHLRGDIAPQHNIPGAPQLDPITGALFLIGLAWLVKTGRLATPLKAGVVLLWLFPMLPSIATDSAPHAMRALGAAPAVCLLAALGLEALVSSLERIPALRRVRASAAAALLLLTAAGAWNYRDYFHVWGPSDEVASIFSADTTRFVAYLQDLAESHDLYVSPFIFHSANVKFLGLPAGLPVRLIEDTTALTSSGAARDRVFLCDGPELSLLIEEVYPEAEILSTYAMWEDRSGRIYRVPAGTLRPALAATEQEGARFLVEKAQLRFERMLLPDE